MFVIQIFMLPVILSRDDQLTYEIHIYILLLQSLMVKLILIHSQTSPKE